MKRICMLALVLLLAATAANAGPRLLPTGAASHMHVAQMGMGGVTSVICTNSHTLFYNPALLNRQSFALEITPVQTMYGSDLGKLVQWASDNADSVQKFDQLTPASQQRILNDAQAFDDKWIGVNLAPYVGFATHHFGVGTYAVAQADLKVDQGIFVPSVALRGFADAVLGAGYGWEQEIAGSKYELGATARFIQRRTISPMKMRVSEAGQADSLAQRVQDELTNVKSGFGLDVGGVRNFPFGGRDVTTAVVVQDIIGSLDGYVKPNVKLGALYPVMTGKSSLLKRLDVALEFNDIFNRQGVSFFSRVNTGFEANTLGGFLKLRGGIHQGYPVYGAGLRLAFLQLDYAYYTDELGTGPGQFPQAGHRGQISLGW